MGYAQAHIEESPLQLLDNQGRTMTKEEEFTQTIRDGGNWVAVESEILGKIVDEFLKTKQRFPDELAEIDVRYWADKGKIKPPGFYARRWKWGRTTVYDFLKKRGLVEPKKLRTSSEQSSEQTPNKNLGNQPEIKEPPNTARTPLRTSSEQYIQTTDKRDISLAHAREAKPPFEVWPKPEPPPPNPINPQTTPPDDDAVKAWAALAGIPPDEAVNIADHFRANEWEDRNGNPIRNWQAKIRGTHNSSKARNATHNTSHEKDQRTSTRTTDGHEQLNELRERIERRKAENSTHGVGGIPTSPFETPN